MNQRQILFKKVGNGRPLLLLPNGGQNQTELRLWLGQLSRCVQLITYTSGAHDGAAQLAETDRLHGQLGYERLFLFGFVKGGLLALAYALRYPARVIGLILCSLPVDDGTTLARCHQIETPVLILAGQHDLLCPPEQTAEPYHASLHNSQLVIFDKSGHCPFVDETERLTAVVDQWLIQVK